MVSGAPNDIKETLTVFGEKIGIAFQLADDVIDIASESHQSGKTPGTDLREGVPTLVTLNVMKSTRPEDRELVELLKAPIKDEDMPTARWVGFIVIWFALAALGSDLVRSSRAVDNRIA